eukprot:240945-Chlamydomonas_euryale.AAC.1
MERVKREADPRHGLVPAGAQDREWREAVTQGKVAWGEVSGRCVGVVWELCGVSGRVCNAVTHQVGGLDCAFPGARSERHLCGEGCCGRGPHWP